MSFSEIQRLRQDVTRANPRDPEEQAELLRRIQELRDLLDGSAADDLVGYLDAAAMMTGYLCQMAGIGPEEIRTMTSRLLGNVERAFGGPAVEQSVVQAPVPVEPARAGGGLRLAGGDGGGEPLRLASELFLGEVLIQLGFCSVEAVQKGLRIQRATGLRIGEALVDSGAVTWEQIQQAVKVQSSLRHPVVVPDQRLVR